MLRSKLRSHRYTRPWYTYGEGLSTEPCDKAEGCREKMHCCSKDICFTKAKDGKTLYAILLDWPEGKELLIESLNSNAQINSKGISSVSMLGTISII